MIRSFLMGSAAILAVAAAPALAQTPYSGVTRTHYIAAVEQDTVAGAGRPARGHRLRQRLSA